MAIYRPDQSQFSFASEGVQGADSELMEATPGTAFAFLKGAITAGQSEIEYDNRGGAAWVVGDFVRIGVDASGNASSVVTTSTIETYEVRRIESNTVKTSTTGFLRFDRPLAFAHVDNATIVEVTAANQPDDLSVPAARFMPGAYTSVTVPDLTPTLEPRYFLGNSNRRNFTEMYRGTQAYSGTLGGVTALNGFMLRFGIGNVRTALITDSDYGGVDFLINDALGVKKGAMHITVNGAGANVSAYSGETAVGADTFIQIIDKTSAETGTHTAAGASTTVLTDSAGDFIDSGVQVGDVVYNLTDESVGVVTAFNATTVTVDDLVGGSGGNFEQNDVYIIVTQGTNSTSSGANDGTITGTYQISRTVPAAANPATDIFLKSPLKEDYADDSYIIGFDDDVTTNVFKHFITEANLLPTMTWHLRMLDSDAGNAFQRRSLGGMVDTMSIAADEGGMLTVGWDTVNFMGTIHNLEDQKTVGTSLYSGDSVGAGMPGYAIMDDITDTDIDFPTTEPYYFSEGTVYIGGAGVTSPADSAVDRKEFARVRDFTIGISNAIEQRYYVSSRHGNGRRRGPNEMREGRREYTFSATVSLNDSEATTGNDIGGALELYKQLLLEGNYGSGSQGFNVRLEFTRGTNDTMIIDLPADATAATGLAQGGVFLRAAPHDITEDPTMQTSIDCVARNMKIVITDGIPVYP